MKKLYNGFILLTFLAALSSSCAPSMTQSQLAFGVWAAEQDLWNEAVFRWTRVLEENPTSIAALNNLAVAYEKQGLWDEAEKAYQAALKIAPKNPSIKANYEKFQKGWAEAAEKAGEKNEKK
jgi:Flp pilus assembly protein TadD